jgi:hypothetical protein
VFEDYVIKANRALATATMSNSDHQACMSRRSD